MKKDKVYVMLGTMAQAANWALKNNVSPRDIISLNFKYDRDKLLGWHGTPLIFIGRDRWWMHEMASAALEEMQKFSTFGEDVRFIVDESPNEKAEPEPQPRKPSNEAT